MHAEHALNDVVLPSVSGVANDGDADDNRDNHVFP